ncbi:MAG: Radical domain protein [Gemmatimonadetes bacterium]|nr:Radical domain protein [Gemmatimonadota bacterium]
MASPARDDLRALPRVDTITNLPILILFPHSRCNCRCVMCDIWRSKDRDELTSDEVSTWVHEWRALGVRRVVLSGGEALLHSRLWELCDHLRAADIGITILSTGLLLERHAAELVRRCDDVVVSLDGPPAIHDIIRNIPRAFARLAEGVSAVKTLSRDVKITGRCTVQRANFRHLRATVSAARGMGLDRISFLAADVSSEAFNRPGGWDSGRASEVALQSSDLALLAAEIDALESECADAFHEGFIAESPQKLRARLVTYYGALLHEHEFAPVDCNAPWVSSVIESDGTVRPCFFQPPLGNIRSARNLGEILNSPAAIAWRAGLDVSRNEICRRCVCSLSLESAEAL